MEYSRWEFSAIVFAGIALHWYYQIQTEEKPWKSSILPFLVRCEETEEAMIIEAKQDLTNVSIKDKEENVICSFNTKLARNSPLRFGALALGQQVDMWLSQSPNLAKRNFTYPQNVRRKQEEYI